MWRPIWLSLYHLLCCNLSQCHHCTFLYILNTFKDMHTHCDWLRNKHVRFIILVCIAKVGGAEVWIISYTILSQICLHINEHVIINLVRVHKYVNTCIFTIVWYIVLVTLNLASLAAQSITHYAWLWLITSLSLSVGPVLSDLFLWRSDRDMVPFYGHLVSALCFLSLVNGSRRNDHWKSGRQSWP